MKQNCCSSREKNASISVKVANGKTEYFDFVANGNFAPLQELSFLPRSL
jgi:hypothetical protein